MKRKKFILFSGGTGGHVIPAVNFGNYLINFGHECILFVDQRGLKYTKKFKGKIIKINSHHLSTNFLFKIFSLLLLLLGLIKSFYFLILIRPSYCIGFGSYATFMPLIIATILKFFKFTEIYLHEQNSVIGKVNLFFLPVAKKIFLNFLKVNNKYINSDKFTHVGLPDENKNNFYIKKNNLSKQNKLMIFVYGGSQGSINLNNGFFNLINQLPKYFENKLTVVMQSSVKPNHMNKNIIKKLKLEFVSKNFFKDINKILISSDLILSRAGAGTIFDIIKFNKPSILVPLPNSIYNHQFFNAKYLHEKKAVKIIEQKNLYSKKSFLEFKELLSSAKLRTKFENNLKKIKVLDANKKMIETIIQ